MATDTYLTTNMVLTLPVVGVRAGPTYASDWNTALSTIDAHDHSSGKGVKVTPSGLNINANLSFGSNSATALTTAAFDNQSASLSSSTTRAVYVAGGDLYYNNGSGTAIQLTSGSAINVGSVQGISGLASPASAVYSSPTFTFKSAASTYGKMAFADLDLYTTTASVTNKITLKSPTVASSYTLTLPSAVPASTAYVSMSSSGTLATASADGIAAALTTTGTGSIVSTMSATNANDLAAKMTSTGTGSLVSTATSANADTLVSKASATGANAIAATRTRASGSTVAAGGVAISTSSSNFSSTSATFVDVTNLTVTITTSGRPVRVQLMDQLAVGSISTFAGITATRSAGSGVVGATDARIAIMRDANYISIAGLGSSADAAVASNITIPGNSIGVVDDDGGVGLAAGTYTYKVQVRVSDASRNTIAVSRVNLCAYEL